MFQNPRYRLNLSFVLAAAALTVVNPNLPAVPVKNPVSVSMMENDHLFPGGPQNISLRLTNGLKTAFTGRIHLVINKISLAEIPVALAPETGRELNAAVELNNAGQQPYQISLLDETGAARQELQGNFSLAPALRLYPLCPCDIPVAPGSANTVLDAEVNLAPAQRQGLQLLVTVKPRQGGEPQHFTAPVPASGLVEFKIPLPTAVPGDFLLTAQLEKTASGKITSAKNEAHVLDGNLSKVQMGPDGYLRVAGKPFFPLGLYSSIRDGEISRAGFNVTHNYAITTGEASEPINPNDGLLQELLDKSWANGMRMMVELPRKAIERGDWAQVRRRIQTFRYHPGLLCWGSEERVARGLTSPANINALYHLVHDEDPNHPLIVGDTRSLVRNSQADKKIFFPDESMDIGIWWWYPIPLSNHRGTVLDGHEGSGSTLQPPSWLGSDRSSKPLWVAVQTYRRPAKNDRFPTPAEYRAQAYLSIIRGTKGIFFYTGSGEKDFYHQLAGIMNQPEAGHWEYVKQLVRQLRDFSPVILSPPAAEKLVLTPADAPVEFTTRVLDGKTYVIAANEAQTPQDAVLQGGLLRGKTAVPLSGTPATQIAEDKLTAHFAPLAVHIYRLE